jgi:predicted phosphodiesterase
MKIAFCSDVHLEFGPLLLKNEQGADLLILAGDIIVAADVGKPNLNNILELSKRDMMIRQFFEQVSREFPQTIYIAGNHEHYHGNIDQSGLIIKKLLDDHGLHNISFLENETVNYKGFNIFAGTMWTDFNKEDTMIMMTAEGGMNDYRLISIRDGRLFSPSDAVNIHKDYLTKLAGIMDETTPTIVVSHHGPTTMSVHPRYKENQPLNWAYHSDLSEFILDHPQIKLWFHGHTHYPQDYMVGGTRVRCNPRGYHGYESIEQHFELEYIDTDKLIAND